MDEPITSTAKPALVEQFHTQLRETLASSGIPSDHDQVMVTLRSDGRSRHSVGVATRIGDHWTFGATFEKQARRQHDYTLVIGGSWKR